MGSLYRSEEMAYCQLFVQSEFAYSCVAELGELALTQFKDLNPEVSPFQRRFVSQVRRCDEMERKLRFLEKELIGEGIKIVNPTENPPTPLIREMSDLEAALDKLEKEVNEINSNSQALKTNFLGLTELKHVLAIIEQFFTEWDHQQQTHHQRHHSNPTRRISAVVLSNPHATGIAAEKSLANSTVELSIPEEALNLLSDDNVPGTNTTRGNNPVNFGFATGVISRDRIPAFERMLWRASHGNVFLKHAEIETMLEDPKTGDQMRKSVFLIMFHGQRLRTTVIKICEGFRANLYPCAETHAERGKMAADVESQIGDLGTVLRQTESLRHRVLQGVAQDIGLWFVKVGKMKAVYDTLNLFTYSMGGERCLVGECWCPTADLDRIRTALQKRTSLEDMGLPTILNCIETNMSPPTFNRTNKFTKVFQSIVDSYGVASYREVNPAPFTIVSFPFLFSLMFGDAGHGILMLAVAVWMVASERKFLKSKSDNEIWNIFFGGRYIILLMGAFSIYAGLMYNDVFSKSINVFGSAWFPGKHRYDLKSLHHHHDFTLDPTNCTDMPLATYPFGMDPVWMLAENKISWLNSFKMKISIIFGISQMYFGVILGLLNHRYFHDSISIFCEFIPQMVFLTCMFGYLIVLIFYKWITIDASMSSCAPSLLIGLINMFLYNYPTEPCSSLEFYSGQKTFQSFLLLLLVACIPWLLITKPLALRRKHSKKARTAATGNKKDVAAHASDQQEAEELVAKVQVEQVAAGTHGGDHHEEFDFGEIIVHQCIHTIEYCLGCISHTASYLRLWALSLAHAELSEVLWKMVFHLALTFNGYIGVLAVFILFLPWACLTVTILLLMEGLSAFLHTLRLHWVEFQSKFYKGDGYLFVPFSFKKLLTEFKVPQTDRAAVSNQPSNTPDENSNKLKSRMV